MDLFGKKFIARVRDSLDLSEDTPVEAIHAAVDNLCVENARHKWLVEQQKELLADLMKQSRYWREQAEANQRLLANAREQIKQARKG